jgi:hypothetical protein
VRSTAYVASLDVSGSTLQLKVGLPWEENKSLYLLWGSWLDENSTILLRNVSAV